MFLDQLLNTVSNSYQHDRGPHGVISEALDRVSDRPTRCVWEPVEFVNDHDWEDLMGQDREGAPHDIWSHGPFTQ
jgi:hypothetical protein